MSMIYLRPRYRKPLSAVIAACWLFALVVSVVHACGLDADLGYASQAMAMTMSGPGGADDGAPPGCAQFCAENLPLVAKLKLVQDQPSAQPMLNSSLAVEPLLTVVTPVASLLRSTDPPPAIAVYTRFVRLAL